MAETVTKEDIKAAIDTVPAEQLETIDQFIKSLTATHATPKGTGEAFMEKMRKIRIHGPADWSENLDDYLYHGKKME